MQWASAIFMPGHGARRVFSPFPVTVVQVHCPAPILLTGGEPIVAKGKYQKWLEPEGLLLLEGWARDGLTDEQIAHNMGVTAKTLYEWKNR